MAKSITISRMSDEYGVTTCAMRYDVTSGTYRTYYNDLFDYSGQIVRACKVYRLANGDVTTLLPIDCSPIVMVD